MTDQPRIPPGRRQDLGVINWVIARIAGRVTGGPTPNIFTTLGRQRGLFRGWLHFSGRLMPGGKLPRTDSELVILRVAELRECEYEKNHHVRIGRRVGLTAEQIAHVSELEWSTWSPRQRLLLEATTQLVEDRGLDDTIWERLRREFDEPELIELIMLVGQYDSLATTLLTLRVQPEA